MGDDITVEELDRIMVGHLYRKLSTILGLCNRVQGYTEPALDAGDAIAQIAEICVDELGG